MVVRLRQAAVADIRHALREGTVDLAVVALDRQQQRGLVTRLLVVEEMVLVARSPVPTGPDGTVTLAEIARLPLVDFTPGWAIRSAVDRAFRAAAVEREDDLRGQRHRRGGRTGPRTTWASASCRVDRRPLPRPGPTPVRPASRRTGTS